MAVVVDSGRPFSPFTAAEDRPRHLEFPQFTHQRHSRGLHALATGRASNSFPRANIVSRETSLWPSRSERSFFASSSCICRASGLDCGGPASNSMISSWEQAGLPVAACISSRKERRPASNNWVAEEILLNGAVTCCQELFSDPFGICPCRARICQSPTLL